jgi:hypothetical protein
MANNKSRIGTLVGLVAAAGAFGFAGLMSAATAPTARADDFSDVIGAVEGDYTTGAAAFTAATEFFSDGYFVPGLSELFTGADDYGLSAPNDLLIGTIEVLTNETFDVSAGGDTSWELGFPVDFSDGASVAEQYFADGETDITTLAPEALSLGDYGDVLASTLYGADLLTVTPLEELLLGAAASF